MGKPHRLGLRISSRGVLHVVRGRGGFVGVCGVRLRPLHNSPYYGVVTPTVSLMDEPSGGKGARFPNKSYFDILACRRCARHKARVQRVER